MPLYGVEAPLELESAVCRQGIDLSTVRNSSDTLLRSKQVRTVESAKVILAEGSKSVRLCVQV